ncbi:MAG TPA: hypothetical protein VMH24_06040 [Candidatus Sulfotelmatobacter sp.]|nr:hypothetical protein [Candidatus Sulfotelmatobacter sp.]
MPGPWRRAARAWALGLVAGAVVLACGATPSASPASSTPTGQGSPAAGTADPGAARLHDALTSLGAGYDFDASVKLGGAVATEAKGRWIGGASQFVLDSGGRSVTYRSVPPNAWVQQGDGSWIATQGPIPSGNPLAAFLSPISVQSAPAASPGPDGSGTPVTVMTATYAAAALGLSGTDPVAVTIQQGPDGSLTITYLSQTSAGAATSTTVLSPTTDTTPILPPGATAAPSQ